MTEHHITGYEDVRAVFVDPTFVVTDPARDAASTAHDALDALDQFQRRRCRFTDGADHDRRRALVVPELAAIAPADARARAHAHALALALDEGRDDPAMARRVPLQTIAELLGIEVTPTEAETVAAGVRPTASERERGDASATVAVVLPRLVRTVGDPDVAANLLGLLVQTCDATAALIDTACAEGVTIDHVLRHAPPVRATRRFATEPRCLAGVAIEPGDLVVLDLGRASLDPACPTDVLPTFGLGPRACPGAALAVAMARGVIDALTGPVGDRRTTAV
jgi:cytochrome P450